VSGRDTVAAVPPGFSSRRHALGVRAVALFEAAKGLLVLGAGSGLLLQIHRDWQGTADRLVTHLHLNPASHYSRIFLRAVANATPGRIRLLALGALVYAVFRLLEAWGLWRGRHWAEWLGVATGAIYVPFEAAAFLRHPGPEPMVALVLNVAIVLLLARQLRLAARPVRA
jgi:uncharacterized membrane protein (DUF2068 family)